MRVFTGRQTVPFNRHYLPLYCLFIRRVKALRLSTLRVSAGR